MLQMLSQKHGITIVQQPTIMLPLRISHTHQHNAKQTELHTYAVLICLSLLQTLLEILEIILIFQNAQTHHAHVLTPQQLTKNHGTTTAHVPTRTLHSRT